MDNASETSHSSPETAAQAHVRRPSRAERPCDTCRKRKSRCVKEPGQHKCVLCTFHHRDCTYLGEPQRRKRKGLSLEAGSSIEGAADEDERWVLAAGQITSAAETMRSAPANPSLHFLFSPAVAHKKPRHPTPARDPDPRIPPIGSARSLLDRTLGLHRTTHSKFVGASSLHDGLLLDLTPPAATRAAAADGPSKLRRVDGSTVFVSRQDTQTLFHSDDEDDLEAIEQIVRPHGPALVSLYFRIVHPSYPILHKGVFLEKYARTYMEFSPPLLAAVYALAMDWWDYDRELSSREPPDGARLIKAATKTLTSVMHRPKLSTVQAGLLLLQRSGGDSWPLTSQVVAVGQELGLHLDCSGWNIPEWEKGLRRRITWAIYMQDKWGALIHGRPSHIMASNWQTRPLSLRDFPESAADEDDNEGSTEVEKGRYLFMHLTSLTEIMAEALDSLYGLDQSRNAEILAARGIAGVLELVKPVAMKLKDWAASMPPGLRMEDVKTRKLCSNGYLHLSYFASEIMIHRYIIRSLPADTPLQLRTLCRDAARSRLDHAMAFVESLRPEHLQGFWWFASSRCLAVIGAYAALLWATSVDDDESDLHRQKLDDFRWSLKVRAKGSTLLTTAIRELDDCLEDVDFRQLLRLAGSTPASVSVAQSVMHQQELTPTEPQPPPQQQQQQQPQQSQEQLSSSAFDEDGYGAELADLSTSTHFDLSNFGDPAVSQSLFSDLGDLGLAFGGLDDA